MHTYRKTVLSMYIVGSRYNGNSVDRFLSLIWNNETEWLIANAKYLRSIKICCSFNLYFGVLFFFFLKFTSRNRVCITPIGMANLSCMRVRSYVKSNRINVKTPNIANMLLAGLFAFFIHWKFHWEHLPALLIHININANIIQFLGNPMFVLFFSLKHAIINTIFSCTWFQFLWFFFSCFAINFIFLFSNRLFES